MSRVWAYRCRGCGHRVAVPFGPDYMTWLAWQRVRWHRLWCREAAP